MWGRLSGLLESRLDPARCNAFNADLKLSIHALRRYRYPDLSVVCGPLEYDEDVAQAVTNPVCLVEVTSESSKEADYTTKAKQYMEHIPALRDYLVVVQDERFVSLFSRKGPHDDWRVRHYTEPTDAVTVESIGVTVTLAEVYHNIEWRDGKAMVGVGTPSDAA